jgi:hypothetical protein
MIGMMLPQSGTEAITGQYEITRWLEGDLEIIVRIQAGFFMEGTKVKKELM